MERYLFTPFSKIPSLVTRCEGDRIGGNGCVDELCRSIEESVVNVEASCGTQDEFCDIKLTIRSYFDEQLAELKKRETYSSLWFATGGHLGFNPVGVLEVTCEVPVCFVNTAVPLVKAYEEIEKQLLLPQNCICFIYLPIRRSTRTSCNSINTGTFTTQFLVSTIMSPKPLEEQ
jgi:hypothetical protein